MERSKIIDTLETYHRVARLTFVDARVVFGYLMSGNQMLFGVPDEISDVRRRLRMVER